MTHEALVDLDLEELVSAGLIRAGTRDAPIGLRDHIEPMSIDLPVSGEVFRMNARFKPQNVSVRTGVIEGEMLECHDLAKGPVTLERGGIYYVELGSVRLPSNLRAVSSPKSSIGRIDTQVRLLVDHLDFYDTIPYGGREHGSFRGQEHGIWAEITPRSFRITLNEGDALNQLRLFNDVPRRIDPCSIEGLITAPEHVPQGPRTFPSDPDLLVMHFGVPSQGTIGYQARETDLPIDLSRRDHDWREYFRKHDAREQEEKRRGAFDIEHGAFYLFATADRISMPPHANGEIMPYSHWVGDLRSHYAGFVDGGFGHGTGGNVIVLEVRSQESGRHQVRNGDPIYLMRLFGQTRPPRAGYDTIGSNYRSQLEPKLAKFFSDPPQLL